MIKNPYRKYIYYTHIWVGLLTAGFLVIYLVTGVFLNHKTYFSNMETWENKYIEFDENQKAAGQEFAAATQEFAAAMIKYTKKPQYDNIYVEGTGESTFLDRSGKNLNFHVKPSGEIGVLSQGYAEQPWNFMNEQIHRNGGMTAIWRGLSTALCAATFIVLVAGCLILPWKRLEVVFLLGGFVILVIGIYAATIA